MKCTTLDTDLISINESEIWEINQKLFFPVESKKSSKEFVPGESKTGINDKEEQVEKESSDKVSSEAKKVVGQTESISVVNQKFIGKLL